VIAFTGPMEKMEADSSVVWADVASAYDTRNCTTDYKAQ
jgi:hypothetical protein